jgi:hypothetical protein
MATAKPVPVANTKVLNATVVDTKPTALPVGEVVKLTNAKGKVEYYVGTATGGVSKPATSLNSAISTVKTQIATAEKIQTTALASAQKIELAEIKQELKAQGVPTKEIDNIIKSEKAANTAEAKEIKGLLATDGLQYATRDPVTNTFTASTTKTTPPTSLLTYNDPVIAPVVQTNIKQANDAVAEFQLLHGMTQQFEGKGDNQVGIDPYNIYQALDGNHIQTIRDPISGAVTDYKFSDQVAKAKGDQSGLMNAIGGDDFGKYEARALGQILSTDTFIGDKANVVVDGKGNYFVNDKSGADRYGKQSALQDTGQVDAQGNKIFVEVATDNSKRNKVSVVSTYIQNPDGSFKFGGVSDMGYTHIDKMGVGDVVKGLAIAGASALAGNYAGALLNLTGTASAIAGGAAAGATGAALTGKNILTGALLGGVTGFGVGEIQAAAQAAGGYENLFNQVGSGNFTSFTQAGQNAAALANSAAASASGVDGGGGGLIGGGEPQASINFGDTSVAQGGFPNATNLPNTSIEDYLNSFNADGTLKTIDLANSDYYTDGTKRIGGGLNTSLLNNPNLSNWSNNQSMVENFTGGPATDSGIPGVNPDGTLKQIDLSNSNYYTDGTPRVVTPSGGGLLDTIKDAGSSIYNTLGPLGTVAAGAALVPVVKNALTPKAPAEETYTAPLLVPGQAPTTTVPNFTQNYNNLFNRQGVGAGQFLGYDYLNNINVPPELMGLLGTSAQARPTSLTMPTPTSITPA